ncbi:MAG: alpha/beta hydrolase [Clostridium sp.]|uniref:alpha/beta hydrolase n=1 Tax=Clostridium sp. TaxID=1506 RepID=UPI003F2C0A89
MIFWICILVLMFIIVLLGYVGNYFYNLAINSHTSKDVLFKNEFGNDEEKVSQDETSGENKKADIEWLLNESDYKDEYITSFDKLKLHGYKIVNANKTNKWIIAVHGYTSEGKLMSTFARHFYNMGYNVLIPDLRGQGLSKCDYIGMGYDDRLDIVEWIKFLIKEDNNSSIILFGISMGAATVMLVSGETLPSNVKGIIEDCGYTSVWEEFAYQLKATFKLPTFPVMNVASFVCKIRAGYWLCDGSALKAVERAKVPMLFIHGDDDSFVPYYMLDELYNAATCPKEKLIIKGAGHAKAESVNPKLYWSTVDKFIDNIF